MSVNRLATSVLYQANYGSISFFLKKSKKYWKLRSGLICCVGDITVAQWTKTCYTTRKKSQNW